MAPPNHPAQRRTASRGSLSDRQWSDLRQAARLARSEGVSITWCRDGSMLISPAPHVPINAGNRPRGQRQEQQTTHDLQSMDTQPTAPVSSPRQQSKKQQRDSARLQKWKAKQAVSQPTARWQLLSHRLLWTARKASCDSVWTTWMRHRQAVHKLRSLFWREWTRPHIEPPAHIGPPGSRLRARCQGLLVLGQRSLRDDYILGRTRAFAKHCSGGSRFISGWLRQQAGSADPTMSPGAGTPIPKARNRLARGGRGGRGGMFP